MEFWTIPHLELMAREMISPVAYAAMFGTDARTLRRMDASLSRTGVADALGRTDLRNTAGYGAFDLQARVLVDVSNRSLATEVLGTPISLPVMLAPVGALQRVDRDGEKAAAQGANAAGTIMAVSVHASFSLESIAKESTGPLWFQVYPMSDPEITEVLVRRAEAANYQALVVTVDNNSFQSGERSTIGTGARDDAPFANFAGIDIGEPISKQSIMKRKSLTFTWSDLRELAQQTRLPVVVKGISTIDDALRCAENGAKAIIVSNHGGHALPDARPTVASLAAIAPEVADELEIYVDGGLRNGADVLKALALGARAVLVGRPQAWALAVNGAEGVHRMLEVLRDELFTAMGLCGVTDVRTVTRDAVTSALFHDLGGSR